MAVPVLKPGQNYRFLCPHCGAEFNIYLPPAKRPEPERTMLACPFCLEEIESKESGAGE